MLKSLKASQAVKSIYDINLMALHREGYRNIIMDLDNTITPWGENCISPELKQWVKDAKAIGFTLTILSNSPITRVRAFSNKLGVEAAPFLGKPLPWIFKKAAAGINANIHDTIMIGDQIFTDILGGNITGFYTILVDPISDREFIGTKVSRLMEKIIAGRGRHR